MKRSPRIVSLAVINIILLGLVGVAGAAYFPDPISTMDWDVVFGQIFGGNVPPGGEVAAWDQSGILRYRSDVSAPGVFWATSFYGPISGSLDPHDFTWRVFDGMNVWSARVYDPGTTWFGYEGHRDSFQLNLELDQQMGAIPEPATLVLFGLLGGSGLLAGCGAGS